MNTNEEVKRLEAALAADDQLRARYRDTMDEIARADRTRRGAEVAAMAAAQLGYSFPADAIEAMMAMQPLDDETVSAVAGGRQISAEGFNLNTWLGGLLRGMMKADSAADQKREKPISAMGHRTERLAKA